MLSFQRDQGSEVLPVQKPDAGDRAPGDSADKSQEQEYLTVAAHGKRTRKSTTVLAVLFIIGLLCLWFMIKKSTPQAASASAVDTEGAQVEAAIARLTGVKSEMFGRMDEIVSKFYEFSDVPQVQVGELVKNPFKIELFLANAEAELVVEDTGPETDVEMLRRQQIRQKAKGLRLLSIMQTGRGNSCMINSDILYEGDSTEDFKVRHIGDDFVKLEWNSKRDPGQFGAESSAGVEVVLRLSE